MHKVALIIIIVVFQRNVFSNTNHWMINLPSEIKNVLNQSTEPPRPACQTDPKASTNPYNSCLKELCGQPPEFVSLIDRYLKKSYSNIPVTNNALKQKKILVNKINQYFILEAEGSINFEEVKQKLHNEIVNIKKKGFSYEFGKPSGLMSEIHIDSIIDNHLFDMGNGSFAVDRSFFLNSLEPSKLERLSYYSDQLDKFGEDPLNAIRYSFPKVFLRKKYPRARNTKEALENYLNFMIGAIKELKIKIGRSITSDIDFHLMKSKAKNGDLTSAELSMIVDEGYDTEMMLIGSDYISKYEKSIFKERYHEIIDWVKKNEPAKLLELLKQESEESKKKDRLKLDKAVEVCVDSLERNWNKLPSRKQVKDFQNVVISAKHQFIEGLKKLSGISNESLKIIIPEINDITFQLPYSKEQWVDTVFKYLDYRNKTEVKFNQSVNFKEEIALKVYSILHPGSDDDDSSEEGMEEKYSSDISRLCEEMEQPPFTDKTYTALGNVLLSYTMAQGPKSYQRGVIFHEIAHNLNRVFDERPELSDSTKKAFVENKKCLKALHTTLGTSVQKYFREDFADHIAMRILPPNTKSYMCEYTTYLSQLNEYVDDSLTADLGSSHSSVIFRILRGAIDSGKIIPETCINALRNNGVLSFPTKCTF